jgi:rubrerythrin
MMSEEKSGRGRQRIIKDIETVDQAVKAEKDVEAGYHGVIEENISYWLAVEEDIVESYTKLLQQTNNEKIKSTLTQIVEDSRNHVRMLTTIKQTFNKIMTDEQKHARLLEGLRGEFHK